jgi:hypothetical protein
MGVFFFWYSLKMYFLCALNSFNHQKKGHNSYDTFVLHRTLFILMSFSRTSNRWRCTFSTFILPLQTCPPINTHSFVHQVKISLSHTFLVFLLWSIHATIDLKQNISILKYHWALTFVVLVWKFFPIQVSN